MIHSVLIGLLLLFDNGFQFLKLSFGSVKINHHMLLSNNWLFNSLILINISWLNHTFNSLFQLSNWVPHNRFIFLNVIFFIHEIHFQFFPFHNGLNNWLIDILSGVQRVFNQSDFFFGGNLSQNGVINMGLFGQLGDFDDLFNSVNFWFHPSLNYSFVSGYFNWNLDLFGVIFDGQFFVSCLDLLLLSLENRHEFLLGFIYLGLDDHSLSSGL